MGKLEIWRVNTYMEKGWGCPMPVPMFWDLLPHLFTEDDDLAEECERLRREALEVHGNVPSDAHFKMVREGWLEYAGRLTEGALLPLVNMSQLPGMSPISFAK